MKRLYVITLQASLRVCLLFKAPTLSAVAIVNQAHLILAQGSLSAPAPEGDLASQKAFALYRLAASFDRQVEERVYYRFLEFKLTGESQHEVSVCPNVALICIVGLKLADKLYWQQRYDEAADVYRRLARGCLFDLGTLHSAGAFVRPPRFDAEVLHNAPPTVSCNVKG